MELQDVVDEAARLLGAPVTLEDRAFRLLAFSSHEGVADEADDVRLATVLRRGSPPQVRAWFEQYGIAAAAAPVRTPASTDLGITARICLPLREGGTTYGYLWVADHGQDDDRLAALYGPAGPATRAAIHLARGARSARLVEERLLALLGDDPRAADRSAAELVASGRLDAGAAVRVVVLAQDLPPGRLPAGVLRADHDGRTVLVVHRLDGLPGGTLAGLVGGAGSAVPPVRAAASYAQAQVALRVAQAVPASGPLAVWDDLGPYRLLALASTAALRDAVVDDPVRRLLEDPTLHATALAYLDAAGSAARTAKALHLHRQTLYYRLARIEAVSGLDLTRGEDRLRLHLGLTLARLVEV